MEAPEQTVRCARCGTESKTEPAFGHCPTCLIELGLASMTETWGTSPVAARPRQFGDYQLLEQIGRGGMGVVYKARQISLNRTVALKMVLDSQLGSPVAVRRFQIEAEAAARLDHPNVVPIYEIGEEDHQHFFSMKLVEGASLSKRVSRGEFKPASPENRERSFRELHTRVARLIAETARAVHYAHEHGVLHRDIKPANILVDDDGHPHLTDFGLAKLTDTNYSLSNTGGLMGTPTYMAPEQAAGGKCTVVTDVYSLGTILYELLTGRAPFSGSTALETLRQITEQEPLHPTKSTKGEVDLDLATICLKCLEKNPAARFSTALQLAEDLERWLRHEPIKARRAGPVLRASRWTRRNPTGATLIVSLFLGFIVSLGLVQMLIRQKHTADQHREAIDQARRTLFELIGVSGFWKRQTPSLPIPAKVLALARGVREGEKKPGNGVRRCTLGLLVEDDPAGTVIGYASVLAYLEETINRRSTNQVQFELTMFKRNPDAVEALVNGEVDVLKLGGNSYLKAKQRKPELRLLVSQGPPKRGVIFTRDDSDILTLSDMKGRSIIFGDPYSTISTWAYFHLVQAGVSDTNLSRMEILDPVSIFEANPEMLLETGTFSSHLMSIEAVLTNGFHAGVASAGTYTKHKAPRKGLRTLKEFQSSPVYFVAREGFPPELAEALAEAMIGMKERNLFAGVSRRITYYAPAHDSELDSLREAMKVGTPYFGSGDENEE